MCVCVCVCVCVSYALYTAFTVLHIAVCALSGRYTHDDALCAAGCDDVLNAIRTQTLCVLQDVICALSAADALTLCCRLWSVP